MKDEIPDKLGSISVESEVFKTFANTYLYLVDELVRRKLDIAGSCAVSLDLANAFLNFSNNNKFAESTSGIAFVAEDE